MNPQQVISKIKQKGYWRVEIRPSKFEPRLLPTFGKIREIVETSIVSFRGWDYPHWNNRNTNNGNDYVESWEDWERHVEYWRFYRSAKFMHLKGIPDIRSALPIQYPPPVPHNGYISIISALFTVTEIFEFTARLVNKGILKNNVIVKISLNNILDYQLVTQNPSRIFDEGYIYNTFESIDIERRLSAQDIVTSPDQFALDYIVEIFERFQWNNPPRSVFAQEQKKLRDRKL